MVRGQLLLVTALLTLLFSSPRGFAQEVSNENILKEGAQDLIIIGASGIGGAILGLSTLSFKKHPTDHMRHILVGGALGIIVGVSIVVFKQASKGQNEFEQMEVATVHSEFDSGERRHWHNQESRTNLAKKAYSSSSLFVYNF